ncbi:hypothetical protein D3C83_233200 [compost metagenome]
MILRESAFGLQSPYERAKQNAPELYRLRRDGRGNDSGVAAKGIDRPRQYFGEPPAGRTACRVGRQIWNNHARR